MAGMDMRRAAVVGAGTMGAGIAAHLANAGLTVVLLDVVPGAAARAVERLRRADPAAFMHPRFVDQVEAADLPDGLSGIGEADWIVEAIVEQPGPKRALLRDLDRRRKPGSAVSSNTSTIPVSTLLEGQSEALRRDFLVSHFFNPPRYMRLLELVPGPETRPDLAAAIVDFADRRLGKGVVVCHDRPGFIANRIGAFWLQAAINAARDMELTVETVDAVSGAPMGFPKTGVFGLMDLVGLDLIPQVNQSLCTALPEQDGLRGLQRPWSLIDRLIADGYTGRKGLGGFYRLVKHADGSRQKEALDLTSGAYRQAKKPRLDSVEAAKTGGLRALVAHSDEGGRFARRVLSATLGYAAGLVPEVADDPAAVDRAMHLGYGWTHGPFALIDRLGADWLVRTLREEKQPVPPYLNRLGSDPIYQSRDDALLVMAADGRRRPVRRADGVLLLSDLKRGTEPVRRNGSASLWDARDGVLVLEFHSKMNAIDQDTLAMVQAAVEIVGGTDRYRAIVIHNEGEHFSVGVNLGFALFLVNVAAWSRIDEMVSLGQSCFAALRDAPCPVVGAPTGMALGGGCEILLHCDAIQAHAESYIGLVEAGVGLVPAWGGTAALLVRYLAEKGKPGGPMPAIGRAFETIGLAKVSRSAEEARDLGFLGRSDGITMNRDRLLADAKARALGLVDGYRPPDRPSFPLPGPTARTALGMMVDGLRLSGKATSHDAVVAEALAGILSGGDTDLTDTCDDVAVRRLERQAFMALIRRPATTARMEHMLNTGKPLRN